MLKLKEQLITVLLLCFCLNLKGQNEDAKAHFRILGSDARVETSFIQDALNNFGQLDAFRYEQSRRVIAIDSTSYRVELFSLLELKKPSSAKAREAVKRMAISAEQVRFSISSSGKVKPIVN